MDSTPTFGGGTTLVEAIEQGLRKAREHGLTNDNDVAFAIMVAIDNAGLAVRRKPQPRTD